MLYSAGLEPTGLPQAHACLSSPFTTHRLQPQTVQLRVPLLLGEAEQPAASTLVSVVFPHGLDAFLGGGAGRWPPFVLREVGTKLLCTQPRPLCTRP